MKNLYEKPIMDVIELHALDDIVCTSGGVTDGGTFEDGMGQDNPFKPMPNGWIE